MQYRIYKIILTCAFVLSLAACSNDKAMETCVKTHSHDTCFYLLNR